MLCHGDGSWSKVTTSYNPQPAFKISDLVSPCNQTLRKQMFVGALSVTWVAALTTAGQAWDLLIPWSVTSLWCTGTSVTTVVSRCVAVWSVVTVPCTLIARTVMLPWRTETTHQTSLHAITAEFSMHCYQDAVQRPYLSQMVPLLNISYHPSHRSRIWILWI